MHLSLAQPTTYFLLSYLQIYSNRSCIFQHIFCVINFNITILVSFLLCMYYLFYSLFYAILKSLKLYINKLILLQLPHSAIPLHKSELEQTLYYKYLSFIFYKSLPLIGRYLFYYLPRLCRYFPLLSTHYHLPHSLLYNFCSGSMYVRMYI